MSDKERIATLLTALEHALDLGIELYSQWLRVEERYKNYQELAELKEFAELERQRLAEEEKAKP